MDGNNGIIHTLNGKKMSGYSNDLNLADGNWHHIAVTYDASTDVRVLYVDGVDLHGVEEANDIVEVTASEAKTATATEIRIGVGQNNQYFDGTIESTLIWNRSLSETEIIKRQTIPSTGNESGLIAFHRLDEGSGNQVVADGTTDSDLAGTLTGGASWSSPTTESAWFSVDKILSSEEDGKLDLSKDQLSAEKVSYEQLTSGTLSLQVQAIDAGGLQSSSTIFDLQIPEPPSEDLRPERLQIDNISLTEGDNLQHTGSHLVPLFLRDRNLDIQSSDIALKNTNQTIELSVPNWLVDVGAFVLHYESGTQVLNKTFSASTDENDLLLVELTPQELSALAFMPTRGATGRAPMSLKWTQDFEDVNVPAIELVQPLELRFRDGGDLIPSTLHEDFSSNEATDTWQLYLPQEAKLVDGVSGRRFSLTNGETVSAEDLPGWDVMFQNALTKDDLEITAEIQSDNQIKYTVTGSEAAGFINSLQIINTESGDLANKKITLRQEPENASGKSVQASLGAERTSTIALDDHFVQSNNDDEIIDSNKQQNPFIFRTDRNLIIPTTDTLPDGYRIDSITRLDNAGENDVIDASDVNELILTLPTIDPNSLNNEDIQDVPNPRTIGINFHNDSDVIIASQGAFGIDMSEANRVIEVKASGITKINGKTLEDISSELAANDNESDSASFINTDGSISLWLRWATNEENDDSTSSATLYDGYAAFLTEYDANENINPIGILLSESDAELTYTPKQGTYQSYEINYAYYGTVYTGLSRLLIVESSPTEAVIEHLDRTTGVGEDHQLILPFGVNKTIVELNFPTESTDDQRKEFVVDAESTATITPQGDLDGNMPGLDIGQPSDDPKWNAGELWSTVTIPLRGDQTIVSNGIQTLSIIPKASTTYTLSDGTTSVVATTSDTTNLSSLVNALKNTSDYSNLNFTISASSTNDYLRVTYKDGTYQANSALASLTPEGGETILAENYPYPDEDSRSERDAEPFNLTLETDETIKPDADVVEITLTNDDVQPVLSIINLQVDGQKVTVEANLEVPNNLRPLLSSEMGSARVRLLRHDQLLDIYLGDLEFERSGPLATNSSAEATFTLPNGLMPSSDLRIELEMSRSLFDTSDTFTWEGFASEGGAWQLSRDDVNSVNAFKNPQSAINTFTHQIVLTTEGLRQNGDDTFGKNGEPLPSYIALSKDALISEDDENLDLESKTQTQNIISQELGNPYVDTSMFSLVAEQQLAGENAQTPTIPNISLEPEFTNNPGNANNNMGTGSGFGQTTGTNNIGPVTGGIVGAETGGIVTDTIGAETGGIVTETVDAETGGIVTDTVDAETGGIVTDTVEAETGGIVTDTVDAEFTDDNPGAEFTDGNPGAEFTDGNPGAEFVTGLPGAEFVTGNPGQSVDITGNEFEQAGRFTSATTIENYVPSPTMFENRNLLSNARWLLTAEEEETTGRVFHHAYYRPDLNRNSQNIVNGLDLPQNVIDAAGDRPVALTLTSVETGEVIQSWDMVSEMIDGKQTVRTYTASELDQLMSELPIDAGNEGSFSIKLKLHEVIRVSSGVDNGEVTGIKIPDGSLNLFEQTLHFGTDPRDPFGWQEAHPATGDILQRVDRISFQEGRGVLLIDLSNYDPLSTFDAKVERLINSLEYELTTTYLAEQLELQLKLLGYDESNYAEGLVDLNTFTQSIPDPVMGDGGATWISDMKLRHIDLNGDSGALEASPYRVTVLEDDSEDASTMEAWAIKPDDDLQGRFDLEVTYSNGRTLERHTVDVTIENIPDRPALTETAQDQMTLRLETGQRPTGKDEIISLNSLVTDPDGDVLSFEIYGEGVPPDGITFDGEAGTITVGGIPHDSIGNHLFTVRASGSDEDVDLESIDLRFDVKITPRNIDPIWNLPFQLQAAAGQITQWDLEANNWVLDANGDSLQYQFPDPELAPQGITLEDGVLSVDATVAEAILHRLELQVQDGPERDPVTTKINLVVPPMVTADVATLQSLPWDERRTNEGEDFQLLLNFDQPLKSDTELEWQITTNADQADALDQINRTNGTVSVDAGSSLALLSIGTIDNDLITGDQELLLSFSSESDAIALPDSSQPLVLRDNDGINAELSSQWLDNSSFDLVYTPGVVGMASTGMTVRISSPDLTERLVGAELSNMFPTGWEGSSIEDGTLVLTWSDPLAATWPGSSSVHLGQIRLAATVDDNELNDSPELSILAEAERGISVYWNDSPWLAPEVDAEQQETVSQIVDAAASGEPVVVDDPELAEAIRFNKNGEPEVLNPRSVLELLFNSDSSMKVNVGGSKIDINLDQFMSEADDGVLTLAEDLVALPSLRTGGGGSKSKAADALILSGPSNGESFKNVGFAAVNDNLADDLRDILVDAVESEIAEETEFLGELAFDLETLGFGELKMVELELGGEGLANPSILKPNEEGVWESFDYDPISGTGAIFIDADNNGLFEAVELWLQDGGRGDFDGIADGIITDPLVIASQPANAFVNEAPTDLTVSKNNFDENLPAGAAIATLMTMDPNQQDTFTYELISGIGDTDNSFFTVEGDQLKIKESPDFELKDSYDVRLVSTDLRGKSIQKNFNLKVNDLREVVTNFDFDNNGNITFQNDAVIGLRNLMGTFPGDALTDGALSANANLDNNTINSTMNELVQSGGFDFNEDNVTNPLIDGLLMTNEFQGLVDMN